MGTPLKALFYAVVRRGWTSSGGFAVMKVTSENRLMLFGSVDDVSTRVMKRDQHGIRFSTEEMAYEGFKEVRKLYNAYEEVIKIAQRKVDDLKREREIEIKKLFARPVQSDVVPFSNR